MYGFIPAQDAAMVLLRGAVSELAMENIYLTPAGIKAMVNARGSLTATIDKL